MEEIRSFIMKTRIIVDSTFNLEEEFINQNNIVVIPLNVIIDGQSYQDGVEISFDQVMEAADSGKSVTTSQPSPLLFQEYFERVRDEGATDIVCLTISSTLSGTFQAANIAKNEVTGVNIHLIDTLTTAIGAEILTNILVNDLNEDVQLNEVIDKINTIKHNGGILLNMVNLNALKKSGRIHRIKATIGNLLRVKPIIEFFHGKVSINSKFRTEKQVAEWIIEKMKALLEGITAKIHIYIAYIDSIDRIKLVLQMLKEAFPNIPIKVRDGITPVIATNLGYGGIGIAWCHE